jgi:RHS repeat-associated protein
MPSPASRMRSRVDANVVCGFLACLALLAALLLPLGQQRAYAVPVAGTPVPPVALPVPASPIVPASSAGYLADDWAVTPEGAFTDRIGLQVPAGRAGMQPSLSLRYSSSGGNGLVGVGWSVTGAMSQITRCGRTIATEGTVSGIAYDQSDRYCLDGQKLVAVGAVDYGSGEYGGIDTQYRTENDSFSQIVSVGADPTIASGPDAFVVKTKDGQVLTYEPFTGIRATSGVGFNPTPLDWVDSVSSKRVVWLLTKQADRSGNDIRWTYTGDFSTGDYRPDRITYTNNTGILTGSRYVQFTYEDRPDVAVSYVAGVKYALAKRIKSIDMYAPNPATTGLVWRYNFSYITSNTKRSLLTSITQCSPTGACLKAKQFDWNNPAAVPWFTASTLGQAIPQDGTRTPALQVMDLDGDGTDDAIYSMGGSSDATDPVYARLGYRQNNGAVSPLASLYPLAGSLPANTEVAHSRPLDLDGDGKVDYDARWWQSYFWNDSLMKWDNQAKKFVATGTAFTSANDTDFGDVNGDGLVDELATLSMALNTGTGTFGATHPVPTLCYRQVADTDGDGRAELTGITMVGKSCLGGIMSYSFDDSGAAQAKQMSFTALNVTFQRTLPTAVTGYWMRPGDFNGDGLVDTLILPTDPSKAASIAWNTGAGLVLDSHTVAIPRDKYGDVRVADVNNDGRSDLVAFGAQSVALVSMGDGTFVSGVIANDSGTVVNSAGRTTTQLGDFNGDGRIDVVRVVNSQLSLLTQSSIVGIDTIKSVRDEGATLPRETVTYGQAWTDHPENLTDYTCTYPLLCQRHGMLVVRQVDSQVHNVDKTPVTATTHTLLYSYEDPVADLRGRGFLGFGTFRVWDPQRPTETITTYDPRTLVDGKYYPGAGRPKSVVTVVPILTAAQVAGKPATATARVIETTYDNELRKLNGGASYAVFPQHSSTRQWEQLVTLTWGQLGGQGGSPATTHVGGVAEPVSPPIQVDQTYIVDDYGNPTHYARTTVGGVSRTEDTTYDNRIDDWLIGLPTTTADAATEPDNTSVTRHVDRHYDDLGRLDSQTIEMGNPLSTTSTYGYDQYGVVHTATLSAAGQPDRVSHFDYTPLFPGQPDEEVYVSQTWSDHDIAAYRPSQWMLVHPGYGVVVASEDANGVVDTAQYDDLGRIVAATPAGQAPVSYSYGMRPDAAGGTNGTIVTTTTAGRVSKSITDRLGRTIAATLTGFDGQISTVTRQYDLLGRLASQSRPFTGAAPLGLTEHTYDSLDREVTTSEPGGAQQTATYGMFTTKAFDAQQHETDTTVDVDGRVITRVAMDVVPAVSLTPITTHYQYAPFDLVSKVIDDHGNVTSSSYDTWGRRTQLTEPDRGTTSTTYYPTGEVHTETRTGNGDLTTYNYDDLGRRTAVINKDGTNTFTWDSSTNGIGKLAYAVSADGIRTDFRYDTVGRTIGVDYTDQNDNNATYQIDREYTANGQLASLSYPTGPGGSRLTLGYSYNSRGYLSGISRMTRAGNVPIWSVTDRNADLSLHTGALGATGQISLSHTVDSVTGQLTAITATAGAQKLVGLTYGYDANGLVKTKAEADGSATRSENYGYDSVGRLVDWKLTDANSPTVDTGYSYDTIGNLAGISHNGAGSDKRTLGYNGPNGLMPHALATRDTTVSGGEVQRFEYDGQGRLVRTRAADDSIEREISYTAIDHPRSVTVAGTTTTFAYDAFGQRVKETSPGGSTFTVPGAFEKRTTRAGTSYVYQVQGSDGPVAQIVVDDTGIHTHYLLTDQLGSVTTVVGESGAITQSLFYDPFGARTNADGTPFTGTAGDVRTGFTGARHDDDLGLINMTGRMYDPSLQRFTTADAYVAEPMSGQSWNPYSYVRNSPTNLVDPTGYIYNVVNCGNAPYMPECGAGGSMSGWSGGGGGGYNPNVFNPSFGSDDPWRDREIQREMAEFFGASDAYYEHGLAGLERWGQGQLGREIAGMEQEYGPGGFKDQQEKLAAAAKSDSDGYHAPQITIGPIEITAGDQPAAQGSDLTEPSAKSEEAYSCGDPTTLAGTTVNIQLCAWVAPPTTTCFGKIGCYTDKGDSGSHLSWYNNGDTSQLIDTIVIQNDDGNYTSCSPGVVAPHAHGDCLGPDGNAHSSYSADAWFWNWSDGDFSHAWINQYRHMRDYIWDLVGDD